MLFFLVLSVIIILRILGAFCNALYHTVLVDVCIQELADFNATFLLLAAVLIFLIFKHTINHVELNAGIIKYSSYVKQDLCESFIRNRIIINIDRQLSALGTKFVYIIKRIKRKIIGNQSIGVNIFFISLPRFIFLRTFHRCTCKSFPRFR